MVRKRTAAIVSGVVAATVGILTVPWAAVASSVITDFANITGGNTPYVQLEQTGASGFTPQSWTMGGNEANFFVRDVTNGSTLVFRIQPNAPSNALFVEATTGDIGLGTSSPTAPLHIRAGDISNGPAMVIETSNGSKRINFSDQDTGETWTMGPNDTGSAFMVSRVGSGATEFVLKQNGIVRLRSSWHPPAANPKRGDMYVDRSGGLCVAFSAGTWTNVASGGNCT